ncbi:MAG TPA: CoA-binding protein, partial [Thermoanaerobaculia bacterium]|nr:CoA-binding protein [Thermoanaerobaculia bacterium]
MSDLSLERLMNPRSIAVVGASERADAIGTRVIKNLRLMGYRGRIHPVNPRYGEVAGLACF